MKMFERLPNPDLQRVQLPTSIIAERLRVLVLPGSWTNNRACMRLEAYGCPLHTGETIFVCMQAIVFHMYFLF